tara:strand:+ start:1145 stop:1717 length:573 start_codon:yes stop_codon:yes gene_type:complete
MADLISIYKKKLSEIIDNLDTDRVKLLSSIMSKKSKGQKTIFICGNGGSAGNANHIANDFIYGVGGNGGGGMNMISLSANQSVITCLANDCGYEHIYSEQIKVSGKPGDLLILLSGSGNSKNIINAINIAKKMKIKTFGIFGYSGGKSKKLVDNFIHTKINDMQISEDMQLIIFHICMQLLKKRKIEKTK